MKKSKLIHKIKKIKAKYEFVKFIDPGIVYFKKDEFEGIWPFIDEIKEITVTYFLVKIRLRGFKPRVDIGATMYDFDSEKSYSLNGIAKESTKFPFPFEAGIVKKQAEKFLDTRVFLEDLNKLLEEIK
jgi:hypothetical protein